MTYAKYYLLLLFFVVNLISCDSFDIEEVDTSEIIKLEISPDNIGKADGNSIFTLTASIPKDAVEGKRTVTFETSAGVFKENEKQEIEIQADIKSNEEDQLFAEAKLVAPGSVSTAMISARILETIVDSSITFEVALPTQISLTNNVPAISGSFSTELPTEVFLEATIFSTTGIASSGVKVDFTVKDAISGDIINDARFRDKKDNSNSKGKVSGYLSVGNLNPLPQSLQVIFDVKDVSTVICDSVYIEVF